MLFQTPEFLILFALVLLGIGVCRRWRLGQHWLLLTASYVFYGWWDVRFLMLLLLSTLLDYAVSLGVGGVRLTWRQRLGMSAILMAGTAVMLGINWPAVQQGGQWPSLSVMLQPSWAGLLPATGICLALALLGPFAYELYFRLAEPVRRCAFLWTSITVNLGVLGFFKYFNFFVGNLHGFGELLGWHTEPAWLEVALPVGISFYTFQTMSYTIDVYRGVFPPERSLLRVALFVAYFPQLVAGPILRPNEFLPALNRTWTLRADRLVSGCAPGHGGAREESADRRLDGPPGGHPVEQSSGPTQPADLHGGSSVCGADLL